MRVAVVVCVVLALIIFAGRALADDYPFVDTAWSGTSSQWNDRELKGVTARLLAPLDVCANTPFNVTLEILAEDYQDEALSVGEDLSMCLARE